MKWTVVNPLTGGVQWEAYPSNTHAIDVWSHEKEGFSWCVITDDVDDNAPEGWSPTVEDAKRHAEQAYEEWVEEHDETADIVAEAVAQELTPGPFQRTTGRRRRPPHQPVRAGRQRNGVNSPLAIDNRGRVQDTERRDRARNVQRVSGLAKSRSQISSHAVVWK